MPETPETPAPQVGDHVEVTYRGVLRALPEPGEGSMATLTLEPDGGEWVFLPAEVGHTLRVVEPPEPTAVGTVVSGWAFPDDDRLEAMYVYVLTGTDADGDGAACWQRPGEGYEYRWEHVLEATKHGRRITDLSAR